MSYPVVIISRDRLTYLRELVDWCERAELDITILDNASTYGPLVEWLERSPHNIVRLAENVGPHSPWLSRYMEDHHKRHWVVVTDPDVIPDCPLDGVDHLRWLFHRHQLTSKIGLSLHLDDLPDHYPHRDAVFRCHAHYLSDEWRKDRWLFRVPVDTTFALYRPGAMFEIGGYRTAPPYMARHLPWYENPADLPEDVRYYYDHTDRVNWSTGSIDAVMAGTDWAVVDAAAPSPPIAARVKRALKLRLSPYRTPRGLRAKSSGVDGLV